MSARLTTNFASALSRAFCPRPGAGGCWPWRNRRVGCLLFVDDDQRIDCAHLGAVSGTLTNTFLPPTVKRSLRGSASRTIDIESVSAIRDRTSTTSAPSNDIFCLAGKHQPFNLKGGFKKGSGLEAYYNTWSENSLTGPATFDRGMR